MLPCPRLDYTSESDDPINEQVADLLRHYEEIHGAELPQDARELLKACAHALDGAKV